MAPEAHIKKTVPTNRFKIFLGLFEYRKKKVLILFCSHNFFAEQIFHIFMDFLLKNTYILYGKSLKNHLFWCIDGSIPKYTYPEVKSSLSYLFTFPNISLSLVLDKKKVNFIYTFNIFDIFHGHSLPMGNS